MGLNLARAVPLWAWALVLALLWGGWQYRRAETAGAALLRQERDNAQAVEKALRDALITATNRVRAAEKVQTDATNELRRARDDAAAAAGAAGRLRDHVATLAARAADSCAADGGQAAAQAAGMLADLQRRADERAGILASYADAARIAGEACERAYESLRTP